MKLPSSAILEDAAISLGYKPLTTPYPIPFQRDLLNNVMRDLDQGTPYIDYILVGDKYAVSIWRKGMKIERDNSQAAHRTPTGATTRKSDWPSANGDSFV